MDDVETGRSRAMSKPMLFLGACALVLPVIEYPLRLGSGLPTIAPGGLMMVVAGLALLRLKDWRLAKFIIVAAALEVITCMFVGLGVQSMSGRWAAGLIATAYIGLALVAARFRKTGEPEKPRTEGQITQKMGRTAGRVARRWLDRQ